MEGTVWQWTASLSSTTETTIKNVVHNIKSNHKLFAGCVFLPRFILLLLRFFFSSVSSCSIRPVSGTTRYHQFASNFNGKVVNGRRQHNAFGRHRNVFTRRIPESLPKPERNIFNLDFGWFIFRWGTNRRCQSTRLLNLFFFAFYGRIGCVSVHLSLRLWAQMLYAHP